MYIFLCFFLLVQSLFSTNVNLGWLRTIRRRIVDKAFVGYFLAKFKCKYNFDYQLTISAFYLFKFFGIHKLLLFRTIRRRTIRRRNYNFCFCWNSIYFISLIVYNSSICFLFFYLIYISIFQMIIFFFGIANFFSLKLFVGKC